MISLNINFINYFFYRFSSFTSVINTVVAYLYHFINFRNNSVENLSRIEIIGSLILLATLSQIVCFSKDIQRLKSKQL